MTPLSRRCWAAVLALVLALEPAAPVCAGLIAPAKPGRALSLPRFNSAPQWQPVLRQFGVSLPTPAAYDALAWALKDSGVLLKHLKEDPGDAALTARVDLVQAALANEMRNKAPALLAETAGLRPAELGDKALAEAYEDVRHFQETFVAFAPQHAALAEEALAPVRAEALARRLIDNEGKLRRTAESLGPLRKTEALPQGREGSGAPPLAKRPPDPAEAARPAPPAAPAAKAPSRGRFWRVAAFALSLPFVFGGRAPTIISDLDETLTNGDAIMSAETAREVADILRAGGSYGIVTGSSLDRALEAFIAPLEAALGPDDRNLLEKQVAVATRSGSQVYRWSRKTGRFELKRVASLEGVLARAGVPDGVARVKKIIEDAARHFDWDGAARRATGRGLTGPVVVEDYAGTGRVLTQISAVVTGNDATKEEKAAYFRAAGTAPREEYAAWINARFREQGIPFEEHVAGRTSIDIGVDKTAGFLAVAEELHADPARTIWAGNAFGAGGNDRPAAALARVNLLVGPRAPGIPRSYTEENAGPAGLSPYLRALARYGLRQRAWSLRFSRFLRPRRAPPED